jgi:hypothetical protein
MAVHRLPGRPPSGLRRALLRAPIWLYRAGLGGLLGRRVLLLTHIGRSTGRARQVVLEVAARDAHHRPRTARRLMRFCQIAVDGSDQDYRTVGRDLVPFVRLTPQPT